MRIFDWHIMGIFEMVYNMIQCKTWPWPTNTISAEYWTWSLSSSGSPWTSCWWAWSYDHWPPSDPWKSSTTAGSLGSPWTSWLHLVQVGKISQTLHLAQFRPWNHARALKSSLLTSSGCDPQLFCTTRSRGRVWSKICLVASIHSRMGINRTMRISTWS